MIQYPNFYEGGRWDAERLMKDLFTNTANAAAQDLQGVRVVPWFPAQERLDEWLNQGNGWLRAHRTGGTLDAESQPWVDQSRVQLAALCSKRDDSLDLIEYVTQILYGYGREGGVVHRTTPHLSGVSTTFMRVPGEVVGPQFDPEQMRDERLVPVLFEVHSDMPKGLPDYRESLGLDQ